jgi:hypothetical protein
MKVAELFAKDPRREIKSVIKADERSPEVLGYELDEYVVTDEISGHLREVLSQFIESRPGRRPDKVCFWVSGWFGSGKSHFLKFLGAVLADSPLKLPSGAQVGATKYLCQKWSLPFEAHLGELRTRVVPVNLLDYVTDDTPGPSEIIYSELMTDSGYAKTPWIAQTEHYLALRGLYEDFRREVEEISGIPWPDLRGQPGPALSFMADALAKVDESVQSVRQAEGQLERQREDLRVDPKWLVPRLREIAEGLDQERGRLVILLDEVGLYLGKHQDRYLELKSIAEGVSKANVFGKLWLVVTSQEAPELKVQEVEARREELGWLQDRFELGLALTPENIETVVRERLLKKTDQGAAAVKQLAASTTGAVSLGATLTARRNREAFQPPSAEDLAETYPFLPYQVRLTTEILGQLRAHGGGGEGLTGRERAILEVAQLALRDSGLLGEDLGPLVTFEHLYDAIASGTVAVPTAHEAEIRELANAGAKGAVSVQAVAKALYLLQQVPEWVPATPENISAVLYPRLGARAEDVAAGVRASLAELMGERHQVGEKDGAFRFLAPVERTFEQDVARAAGNLTAAQRKRLGQEILGELLRDLKVLRFRGARALDVKVEVDGEALSTKGYLRLVIVSPLGTQAPNLEDLERRESLRDPGTVWWVSSPSAELANLVDRALAMEAVLARPEAGGQEGANFRLERVREKETLRHSTLPNRMREALSQGTLVAKGSLRNPEPNEWEQAVRAALEERAEEIFYEFSAGSAQVRDEDVGKVLNWHGGALPECYRSLGAVEDGSVREDSPLLSKILEELKRREAAHEPLSGASLAEHFDRPPYGWDERVVRLGLACLVRNGSVEVRTPAGALRSPSDPSAQRALANRPTFKDAYFHPAQVLSEEQRREARELVAELFSAVGETPEELDVNLREGLGRARAEAQVLATRLSDLGLGGARTMARLVERAAEVLELPTAAARLLAVVEPSMKAELAAGLGMLRRLGNWQEANGFVQAVAIRSFITAATGLESRAPEDLRAMLSQEDVAGIWPQLQEAYHASVSAYAKTYGEAHKQLRNEVATALAQLESEPGISDGDLEALKSLSCKEEAPELSSPLFRCPACKRSVAELQRDAMKAQAMRAEILKQLQARSLAQSADGGLPASLERREVVTAPRDLEPLTAALEAYAARVLETGPLDVSISARPHVEEGH